MPSRRPAQAVPEPAHMGGEVRPGQPPVLPPGDGELPRGPGNPPFYDVLGQRYYVRDGSDGYVEQGVASWYGREFHGRRTSNGEVYDMYAMTAAHKTLPLPTQARVTNLATGKSIVVRINDRGPFMKGRLIDLSYGAARELGFLADGTGMVEVTALSPDPATTGATDPAAPAAAASAATPPRQRSMYAQVGAFSRQENAEELKRQLEKQGLGNVVIRHDAGAVPALYRVRIGPVADAAEYDAVAAAIGRLRIGEPRLVVEAGSSSPGG
ncbi:MAG: septal ring lytic transglycosylase RlpA family protein [Gammaproteobacteria bacterium]|nr:septal ring lytic transglycosylase RlpA family protein [Gammaproteobacteria bacterium]